MMLYIKALKNGTAGDAVCDTESMFSQNTCPDINNLIMKHTEDYINSIKTVLDVKTIKGDAKVGGSSRVSTQAEDEDSDSVLGKRSINAVEEDIKKCDVENIDPHKIIKTDFFESENNFDQINNTYQTDDFFTNPMEDELYKMDNFEDFQFTLNELSDQKSYLDLF
jgi:hypothetical protein